MAVTICSARRSFTTGATMCGRLMTGNPIAAGGMRISVAENGREIARARVYFLENDLHDRPYAYIEDVFVEPSARGQGVAADLVRHLIDEARLRNCYKAVAGSRHGRTAAHRLYA